MTKLISVEVKLNGTILQCSAHYNSSEEEVKFAFYIFKNEQRIHISWYSENPVFHFDTQGAPGYYRVVAFLKNDNDLVENSKSSPIFSNPTIINNDNLSEIDNQGVAYLLKGDFWDFPALFYPNENKSLFIMLPSAVDRAKMTLPVFNRWTWADKGVFPGNMLCISDPTLTLHHELQLGWLLGDIDHCATKDLANFIVRLAKEKGIPNNRIVFYGSSAGGFSALALATLVEGSVAVAINPQTVALSYEASKQVKLIQEHCFNGMSKDIIEKNYSSRVNMIERWKNVRASKFILVQNILDHHHFNVHFKPFWEFFGGDSSLGISSSSGHNAWIYKQDGGHVPETIDMAREIISTFEL
ncbi:alpha/beta hydrolase [Aeromonas sanarellii]|uniref:hypothetical protein n=1 Tax=Aeromonas sanarellii TaxID=633415 RepID=UPI0038D183D6